MAAKVLVLSSPDSPSRPFRTWDTNCRFEILTRPINPNSLQIKLDLRARRKSICRMRGGVGLTILLLVVFTGVVMPKHCKYIIYKDPLSYPFYISST